MNLKYLCKRSKNFLQHFSISPSRPRLWKTKSISYYTLYNYFLNEQLPPLDGLDKKTILTILTGRKQRALSVSFNDSLEMFNASSIYGEHDSKKVYEVNLENKMAFYERDDN